MAMRNRRLVVLLSLLPWLACSHAQVELDVKPNQVCVGTPVTVTWKASASPVLSADKHVDGLGSVAQSGAKQIVLNETTTFTLEAGWWMTRNATQASVTVLEPAQPARIGGGTEHATCSTDGWVGIAIDVPTRFWDSRLSVGKVTSPDSRVFRVSHAGITSSLTPSDDFVGLAISGTWMLETRLQPGEGCGAGQPLPRVLGVVVSPVCTSSGR